MDDSQRKATWVTQGKASLIKPYAGVFLPSGLLKNEEQIISGSRSRRHLASLWTLRQRELLMKVPRAAPPVKKFHSCDFRPLAILTTCFADMKVQVKIPMETRAMDVYFDKLYLHRREEKCQWSAQIYKVHLFLLCFVFCSVTLLRTWHHGNKHFT